MSLDLSQRVSNLRSAQGHHPSEDLLLNAPVVSYAPYSTRHPGENETYLAVLNVGQLAFHKPFSGINPTLAHVYGQSQDTPAIHECAAWRLAVAFGPPFTELIPPCVMREIQGNQGSLCLGVTGDPIVPGAFSAVPPQVDAAAFFDSLIAQQDRHHQNYRWDVTTQQFHLIDHGFCFAVAGDVLNSSVFVEHRWAVGREALTATEQSNLQSLAAGANLLDLALFLEADRARALRDRCHAMLSRGTILPAGLF